MNWIPGLSQCKSLVQLACGDLEGAKATQNEFLNKCPGVSQIKSTVELISGDTEAALETQKQCFSNLGGIVNGVPLVGHAKGFIHGVCGDEDGMVNALKSANRTTVVLGSGAAGFLVGGPVGAVAGGIAGGASMDGVHTAIEGKPNGNIALVDNIINGKSESISGDVCDLVFGVTMDGLTGKQGGNLVKQYKNQNAYSNEMQKANELSKRAQELKNEAQTLKDARNSANGANIIEANKLEAKANALYEAAEAKLEANPNLSNGEYMSDMKEVQQLYDKAQSLKGKPSAYEQSVVDKANAYQAEAKAIKANAQTKLTDSSNQQTTSGTRNLDQQKKLRKQKEKNTKSKNHSDDDSDSESECDEPSHKLLTTIEKDELINYINQRRDKANITRTEIETRTFPSSHLGGSYQSLSRSYPNRKNKYEVNHMPPQACYKSPFNKISYDNKPAIIMIYEDHRNYDTTGRGPLVQHDFKTKDELREYMEDEIQQSDFCAALNADLDFLLRDRDFIIKYYEGCKQMIQYCNTRIKGAPCNPDCPKYKKRH